MTRPSTDTAQKLRSAARELLDETGFTGLKIRDVAKKAKVNLGMFHYHFKTKEKFTEEVLQEFYETFFTRFTLVTSGEGAAIERLRRALINLSCFVRDNRRLIASVIYDVVNGNGEVSRFIRKNAPRHVTILIRLILECQKKGQMEKMPLHLAMTSLLPALMAPSIGVTVLEKMMIPKPLQWFTKNMKLEILSDATIERRVRIALRGVAPQGGRA